MALSKLTLHEISLNICSCSFSETLPHKLLMLFHSDTLMEKNNFFSCGLWNPLLSKLKFFTPISLLLCLQHKHSLTLHSNNTSSSKHNLFLFISLTSHPNISCFSYFSFLSGFSNTWSASPHPPEAPLRSPASLAALVPCKSPTHASASHFAPHFRAGALFQLFP